MFRKQFKYFFTTLLIIAGIAIFPVLFNPKVPNEAFFVLLILEGFLLAFFLSAVFLPNS